MNERGYRSVATPARLGDRERDVITGRRTTDRSDKDRRPSRPKPQRTLLVAGAVVLAVILIGAAAAVALTAGGGGDDQAATTLTTPPEGVDTEGDDTTDEAGGEESPLNGMYDVTLVVTDAFSYFDNTQITGDNAAVIGSTSTGMIFIECDGSGCFIDAGSLGLGGLEWTIDGNTFRGEDRRIRPGGDDCAPMEDVRRAEFTIDESGHLVGTMVDDAEPGQVACAEGFRSGARYARDIEGQRDG